MAPPRFQRLVIYGVGLLGGSLGMALKRRGWPRTWSAWAARRSGWSGARQLGTIDEAQTRPEPALEGSRRAGAGRAAAPDSRAARRVCPAPRAGRVRDRRRER